MHRCTSPKPRLRVEGEKKLEEDRGWTKLRHYSPAAFKFYMEQHIENVLKGHRERVSRRTQLEREMRKVGPWLLLLMCQTLMARRNT